ncbi:thiamine pyrophosphate-dependent dehydrogenase E1 component subunit alpha [Salinarimonas chemoclinalis]|uniref:thiamine pyrophosphate-dependent dehydrogenase E1 component subunit alpha n=1 Tax=Salinarimonas chemoclinalis TaxID=3241599 RepID=UPI0035578FAE
MSPVPGEAREPVRNLASNLDSERLVAHLDTMWRIRAFEEAALRGLAEGLVRGAIHPSIGQEAVAAAVCLNLARGDLILSTHRGHGHTLAKGADARAMMRELLGRAGGTCGGKGGSMHIADFSVGMLGANGVVGANIPIAVGAAHAVALRGGREIVACFFGDGAINRGPFLEGLNWARIFRLPVLFVCEDNAWSATTRTADLTAGEGAAARALSLGIPAEIHDGNDAIALDAAARDAIAAVRAGEGPRLMHVRTYRMTGHTAADAAAYRDPAEVEAWRGRDPIARLAAALAEAGVDPARLEAARTRAQAEMADVLDDARAAPWPDLAAAFADVQDVGDPAVRAY